MAAAEAPFTGSTVWIEPPRTAWSLELRPIWTYRHLLYFLTWRDLKVRYKQTALGASWALLQPLLTTVVFTIFFSRVAHLSSEGVPYAIFAFCGTLPWTFFSNSVTAGSNSVVASASMITKVYFPRLALPISSALGALVDLCCAAVLLIPFMMWYGVVPSARLVALPLFVLLGAAAGLAVAIILAALNVRYRDVRYVIPFLTQLWLFATPVAYSATGLGRPWRYFYGINPMVGVVDGFRWSILGVGPAPGVVAGISALATAALLLIGVVYFGRVEQSIADVI